MVEHVAVLASGSSGAADRHPPITASHTTPLEVTRPPPRGVDGTLDQASALLTAAEGTRMHAYIALCLATGIRTEEARGLRWEHVSFGDPDATPPVPASAAVWRSVRAHGDTKTEKSRRTLALPIWQSTPSGSTRNARIRTGTPPVNDGTTRT
jgi:integrase